MSTLERVVKVLAAESEKDPAMITPATTMADLDTDSLEMVEITMAVEEEFSIQIDDNEVDIHTVQEIVDLVDRKLAVTA